MSSTSWQSSGAILKRDVSGSLARPKISSSSIRTVMFAKTICIIFWKSVSETLGQKIFSACRTLTATSRNYSSVIGVTSSEFVNHLRKNFIRIVASEVVEKIFQRVARQPVGKNFQNLSDVVGALKVGILNRDVCDFSVLVSIGIDVAFPAWFLNHFVKAGLNLQLYFITTIPMSCQIYNEDCWRA